MVLIGEKLFRLLKFSSLLSFVLYVSSQMYVQAHNVAEPFGAPYYPRHSAFSLFFRFQSVLQAFWILRLFLSGNLLQEPRLWTPTGADDTIDLPREVVVDSSQVKYAPCYILGNVTLASVSFFWLYEMFVPAQLLCIWSLAIQLYGVFVLLDGSGPHSLSTRNCLTHLVAKTSSGLGFLYVWKGWGTIDSGLYPHVSELIQTGVICLLLTVASGPDPTLGLCLIYDLLALACGPGISKTWRLAFKYDIAIVSATVIIDFTFTKFRGIKIICDSTSIPASEEKEIMEGINYRSQTV